MSAPNNIHNGKENCPIQNDINMDVDKPDENDHKSPTVHALIDLRSKEIMHARKCSNFSMRVCNCRYDATCDHVGVNHLTETNSSNVGLKRRSTTEDSPLVKPSVINENFRANRSRHFEAHENKDESSQSISSHSLISYQHYLDSNDHSESSGSQCEGSSAVSKDLMERKDFLVYKRRRLEAPLLSRPLDCLPDHVIVNILWWLPKFSLVRCAQISKRYYRLVLTPWLWRRLDLTCRTFFAGNLGRCLLRGCVYLRLSRSEVLGSVFSPKLKFLPPVSCNLLFLDMGMVACSPEGLVEVFSVCRKLQKLNLEASTVNDEVLEQLSHNKDLDTVNFSMVSGITELGLSTLFGSCHKLKDLNLSWVGLTHRMLSSIIPILPSTVERLNIAGCKQQIVDGHIALLFSRLPDLLELDISDCIELGPNTIAIIVNKARRLKVLHCSRCYNINIDAYGELRRLRTLKHLSIFGIPSNVLSIATLKETLVGITFDKYPYSCIARPTLGARRSTIWDQRVRD